MSFSKKSNFFCTSLFIHLSFFSLFIPHRFLVVWHSPTKLRINIHCWKKKMWHVVGAKRLIKNTKKKRKERKYLSGHAKKGCHPVVISLKSKTACCYGVDLFVFISGNSIKRSLCIDLIPYFYLLFCLFFLYLSLSRSFSVLELAPTTFSQFFL